MEIYLIVIGKTVTGYSSHCPDVPGCAAVGTSVESVVASMQSALEFHFEGMLEDGDPIPLPAGVGAYSKAMKDFEIDRELLAHVRIDTSRFAPTLSRA